MNITTLPRYLVGGRRAIEEIAFGRWSLLIGLLFVLSAGIARTYDGFDLLDRPEVVLRPLAASLASSTVLFLLVHGVMVARTQADSAQRPPLVASWRALLSLFWMTAPLAWLYAIPVERFLSPFDAMRANLWFLAIVAAWRVLLMARALAVLYQVRFLAILPLVVLFGDVVALAAMALSPHRLVPTMGGIVADDPTALLSAVSFSVMVNGTCSLPFWFIGALVGLQFLGPRRSWPAPRLRAPSPAVWILAVISIIGWTPALLAVQPEQVNRRRFESLTADGKDAEALALLSTLAPDDLPPQWQIDIDRLAPAPERSPRPRPRMGVIDAALRMQGRVDATSTSEWARDRVDDAVDRALFDELSRFYPTASWSSLADEATDQAARIVAWEDELRACHELRPLGPKSGRCQGRRIQQT